MEGDEPVQGDVTLQAAVRRASCIMPECLSLVTAVRECMWRLNFSTTTTRNRMLSAPTIVL